MIRAGAAAGIAAVLAGCADLFDDEQSTDDSTGSTGNDTVEPTGSTTTDSTTTGSTTTDSTTTDSTTTATGDPVEGNGVASVIVVGAGPAGMSAGALLRRAGVDVRVLEARDTYGGRIKHTRDFVDFPIPLGGEWLHEAPDELDTMAGQEVDVELAAYQPDDEVAYYDGTLTMSTLSEDPDTDLKFVGSSWLDFFETYVLPDVEDRIEYGVEIVRVDHTGDTVVLTDAAGAVHEADQAIVTVPLKLLQEGRVEFDPPLPDAHQEAIARAGIWGGMKVFIEFSERFYPVFLSFPDSFTPAGQRLYYDASYGQRSDRHVLGLFTVGEPAERYQALDEGDELREAILAELDEIFDGAATPAYLQHIAQNWNDEPFALGAYLADEADWRIPRQLQERFSDRVYLAGDAYTSHDDWSAVDDAARSARDAVREILR